MNLPLQYQLRRSPRAKQLRIIVKSDLIEVVAPLKVPEQHIKHFVDSHQEWIKSALDRVKEKTRDTPSFAPALYHHGVNIPFQGQLYCLQLKYSTANTLRIQFHIETGFTITLPNALTETDNTELIRQHLTRWMKQQARLKAKVLLDSQAQRLRLQPRGFKIKTQRSRWGSCGPVNDINLNWLLILAPPDIFEYVVIHELCHIEHKNHSQDFWLMVKQYCPDYLQHKLWLKEQGASLMKGL